MVKWDVEGMLDPEEHHWIEEICLEEAHLEAS